MTTAIDRAMHGAVQAPLTSEQRRELMARLIVPAHRRRVADGLTGEDLDTWRYEEIFKACGRGQLRACTQEDYPRLVAHFLRILGRAEKAREWDLRAACGGVAVARRKLRDALRDAADVIERPGDYAAAIARAKFKTPDVERLSERQTWTLVFDMRRAAQKRRGR